MSSPVATSTMQDEKIAAAQLQAQQRFSDAAAFQRMLWHPDDVREIRVLSPGGHGKQIDSGYFDAPIDTAKAAVKHCWQTKPRGVYCTLNPVRPELLARSYRRMTTWAKDTSQDQHVTSRRWLMVDIDPIRAGGVSGISASDDEVEAAAHAAEDSRDWLMSEFEWSEPAMIDSGNGRYLLFSIDLPNDSTSTDLIRHVLVAIAQRFDSAAVEIDRKVYNASRILRIPGTLNRKGDDIPGRPHRYASVIHIPDYLTSGWNEPLCRERLEAVAALAIGPVSGRRLREFPFHNLGSRQVTTSLIEAGSTLQQFRERSLDRTGTLRRCSLHNISFEDSN
jgi:hypothetical protein